MARKKTHVPLDVLINGRLVGHLAVFCDGLQIFYEHVTGYLVDHGYPQEFIDQRLKGNYDFVTAGYAA